jgi:hypothetical protein
MITDESIKIAAIVLVIKRPWVTDEPVNSIHALIQTIDTQSVLGRTGVGARGCLSANRVPLIGNLYPFVN